MEDLDLVLLDGGDGEPAGVGPDVDGSKGGQNLFLLRGLQL
jgi:hypothetical protein